MPTCPGCNQAVSHDELGVHVRSCGKLYGHGDRTERQLRALFERIDALESWADARLQTLEAELAAESGQRSTSTGSGESRSDVVALEPDQLP